MRKQYTLVAPAPQKIAIAPMPESDRTSSGLFLVSNPNEVRPIVGTVVAVCEDYELDGQPLEPLFAEGDVVVIGKYSGTEITIGRQKIIILHEKDVLCRLLEEPDDETEGAEESP